MVQENKTRGVLALATKMENEPDAKRIFKELGGSESSGWNVILADQVMRSIWLDNSDDATRDRHLVAVLEALRGIRPKDEIEGMLATQMIACHNATMECYRRAMMGGQSFEGRTMNLGHATKLSRTYATLVEALNRHRGKAQQKVVVEHVTVNAGGQAIVGNVEATGGGLPRKSQDQPHAITHASSATVPSAIEAEREALPVAGSTRTRSLPNAWRSGRSTRRQRECAKARDVGP
jgi:hypothetical protein